MNNPKFAFFGTDEFAVTVLNTLALRGLVPTLVVTTPDKPKGRHQTLTPSPVKVWSLERNIPLLQPEKLRDENFKLEITKFDCDLFIVASYGKIIPESIFNLPKYKTLNIHPSLLPKLRGPSPVATAILKDMKNTGVTVMQIDALMDHGAILAQKELNITEWPLRSDLERKLGTMGAQLLADILGEYIAGTLIPNPQNEAEATYCKMIEKKDAEVKLSDDPYFNYRKILAYEGWPRAWTIFETNEKKIRLQILDAEYINGELRLLTVIPEGKKEMPFEDFLRGI